MQTIKPSRLAARWTRNTSTAKNVITNQGEKSTRNEIEISKFSAQAQEWWDVDGPFRMLQQMNPVRVGWIRQVVGTHFDGSVEGFQGLKMVDVGCGGGLLSESLRRLGGDVVGLDASAENIEIAKLHSLQDPLLAKSSTGQLEYMASTAEELAATGRRFDVVCALEIVEHVDNPSLFIESCMELINPGGVACFSTMSRTSMAHLLTITLAETVLNWVPRGTHDSSKYLNPEELARMIRQSNGSVVDLKGIGYNPLRQHWFLMGSSSWETSVNYLLAAKKVN
jgi:ubiquinone biosynthesis O-methyltransferase